MPRDVWFKSYSSEVLREWLAVLSGEEIGPLHALFCMAAQNEPLRGTVWRAIDTPYSDLALSETLRVSVDRWTVLKAKYIEHGFIELDANGVIVINNWHRYQPDWDARARSKQARYSTDKKEKENKIVQNVGNLVAEFVRYWNTKATLRPIERVTTARYKQFAARFSEELFRKNYLRLIDKAAECGIAKPGTFKGRDGRLRPWAGLTITYLLKNDDIYTRLLEGEFDNVPKTDVSEVERIRQEYGHYGPRIVEDKLREHYARLEGNPVAHGGSAVSDADRAPGRVPVRVSQGGAPGRGGQAVHGEDRIDDTHGSWALYALGGTVLLPRNVEGADHRA